MIIETIASGSTGNAYLITSGQSQLLIECGVNYKTILKSLKFDTRNLLGCLITHEHKDHTKGLKDVVKAGINCYMSQGTADAENIKSHRIKTVQSKKQFKIGPFNILPFEVEHDAAEPLGFLIESHGERLLFATDTYFVKYKFKKLNYIMIECNYSLQILNENIEKGRVHLGMKNRLIKSHFSLENVIKFLESNDLKQVKEIHLMHLSDTNSNEKEFKLQVQRATGKPVFIA